MIHSLLGPDREMPENIALIGGLVGGVAILLLLGTVVTILIFVVVKSRKHASKG